MRETVVSAPTTQSPPAATQKQAPTWLRARVARYAASGSAIVSAAPSAIGCCAEARTRSRVPALGRLLDRPGRLEEREPLVQVVEDVVVRPCLVDRRDRDRRRAEHERPHHELGRGQALDRRADEQVGEQEAEEVGERLDRLRLGVPRSRARSCSRRSRSRPPRRAAPIGLPSPPADTLREPVTIATTQAPTSTISSSR